MFFIWKNLGQVPFVANQKEKYQNEQTNQKVHTWFFPI